MGFQTPLLPSRNKIMINSISSMTEKISLMVADLGRFWIFVWDVCFHTPFLPRQGSRQMARQRILTQMYEIGIKSVPVVMITGGFVGLTLAIQSYAQLKGIGLETRTGGIINVSVVKELGPVLAAVMLAGRVGGAMTAELGTMRVTEQIDALRAMATDPIKFLVMPRCLACMFLTPLLIIFTDIMGIFGGYVMSVLHLGVNSEAYWQFSAIGVEKWDIFVGISKGFFFGICISLIACYKGFYCYRGAQGVGKACTESFVYCFIAILMINFLLSVVYKTIYDTFWTVKLFL